MVEMIPNSTAIFRVVPLIRLYINFKMKEFKMVGKANKKSKFIASFTEES